MKSPSTKLLLGLAVVTFQHGCSQAGSRSADDVVVERETEIVHEDCDVESEKSERLDANGDGKADVTIVRIGNRELCRALDLNFDGIADSWIYLEDNGLHTRRRERDYDRDGRIDEIALFKKGELVEKRLATLMTNRLDTWEYYFNGRLARTERDSDGDRLVDQWWEYRQPGCPMIHADANRDGRPDPEISVDYCRETGYVPPDRTDGQRVGPTFEQSKAGSSSGSASAASSASAAPPPAPPPAAPAVTPSAAPAAASAAPAASPAPSAAPPAAPKGKTP
jgi:hypothetical protein